jgi:peptide/nickel transport system permease protein
MVKYIIRRILYVIPTVFLISVVAFAIIELPPGSWLDNYVASLRQLGDVLTLDQIANLEAHYGVNSPVYVQYWKWIRGWPRGDFGRSFVWGLPVLEVIGSRFTFTLILSFTTLIFTYLIAIPIALYASKHQYSVGDNVATLAGFIGLSIPNFMLAFILMYVFYKAFGLSPGGLLSPAFQDAPFSLAKMWDFIRHLWIPMIVLGTAGTASLIRVLRATLLDELGKDYVKVARAKGLSEREVVNKHALRIAANPLISNIITVLPQLISGSTITATVLSLPVLGSILLSSLRNQDMYLAGTIILFQSLLVVAGALISDILLAMIDPRIKYE